MYSDTAGFSYENPEIPAGTAHHQEAELHRKTGYPDPPGSPEEPGSPGAAQPGPAAAPGAAGPHEATAVLGTRAAGINELLHTADLDDSVTEDGAAMEDSTGRPATAPRPVSPAPETAQVPPGPQVNQPIGSAPRPVGEEGGAGTKPAFGPVVGGSLPGGGSQPGRRPALDFLSDARMRYWRERAVVMVVTGIAFGIIGNWIVGLTLAIIAGVAHAIWRSRSVAAIPPGARLDKAQRITQRKLARMQRSGYHALHARPIPDSEEMIDHLVVGPTGVYAIDSEKWNRKLPIRTRNGKQLWLGPESKKPRLEHARWEAQKASELLSARLGREIVVRPALAIYGPHIPWDIAVIREVDVFNGERLRQYLKKRSRVREVRKLPREEIARIFEAAEAVLPAAGAPAPDVAHVG
jgi:hypothetical protein